MIKDNFVPYVIADLAVKAGFTEPCIAYYTWEDSNVIAHSLQQHNFTSVDNINTMESAPFHSWGITGAPIYQQLTDWLRETHNIIVEIIYDEGKTPETHQFAYRNYCSDFEEVEGESVSLENSDYYQVYDLALKDAIQLVIKRLKTSA